MQQINLYRSPPRQRFDPLGAHGMALMVLSVSLVMAALLAYVQWDLERNRQRLEPLLTRLEQVSAQLTEMSAALPGNRIEPQLEQELERLGRALERKPRVLAALKGEGSGNLEGFSPYLEALARQNPEGLWLTGFTLEQGGRRIQVSGAALDAELAPLYLQRLAGEPGFAGAAFNAFRLYRDEAGDDGVILFHFGNRSQPVQAGQP